MSMMEGSWQEHERETICGAGSSWLVSIVHLLAVDMRYEFSGNKTCGFHVKTPSNFFRSYVLSLSFGSNFLEVSSRPRSHPQTIA